MINTILLLALTQQITKIPTTPLNLEIKDVSGTTVSIPSKTAKANVLIFVGVDCPIANRMAPEIARIAKDYEKKKVKLTLVYGDPEVTTKDIQAHLKEYDLPKSAVIDKDKALKKATGATVTPQAVVLDKLGKIVYLGRINDLYEGHANTKKAPKKHDLRNALDDVLAGKPVRTPFTEAIGCFLPD